MNHTNTGAPWFVPSSRKSLRQRQGKTPMPYLILLSVFLFQHHVLHHRFSLSDSVRAN